MPAGTSRVEAAALMILLTRVPDDEWHFQDITEAQCWGKLSVTRGVKGGQPMHLNRWN